MSTVIATSVLPDSTANDTLTIGATGDSVVIGGNLLTMNTLQDAGGNTTFVSDGSGLITSTGLPGAMKHILTQTASGASSVSFTTGIDSTYDVYVFRFYDINAASSDKDFNFNGSTDGGSNYNATKTTTYFRTEYYESGSGGSLTYLSALDLAESTAYQTLARDVANSSDTCCAGELHLFSPSNTTYVKHFLSTTNNNGEAGTLSSEVFVGGYFNTTSAVNAIDFKMESGNFDGIIALYGISKS